MAGPEAPATATALATRSEQQIARGKSLIQTMADKYEIGTDQFFDVIQNTIMPNGASKAQTAAFLIVCNRYGFDPFLRQIYAFPAKGGGIVPVVGIDGWLDIMITNPQYDGDTYEEICDQDGKLTAGRVTIFRKDRPAERPIIHMEYLQEVKRNTDPWNNMPHRMLKNRTYVQGIRRAFGVAGIVDQDEAEALKEINITSESREISRATQAATTDLKTKISDGIQNVKNKRLAEKAQVTAQEKLPVPAAPAPPVAPQAPPPDPAPAVVIPEVVQGDTATIAGQENLGFDDLGDIVEGADPDKIISDIDRKDLLAVLKSAPGETGKKQIAVKQKLVSLGYTNTAEIKYRHYTELLAWAKLGVI